MWRALLQPGILVACTFALYGVFLHNPIVFDDLYFFYPGVPEQYLEASFQTYPRWWVMQTFALTHEFFGAELVWYRLSNALLHAATAIALYGLIHRLLSDLSSPSQHGRQLQWPVLLAVLLFLMHPVAVYGAGYLIQRTIVLATLFSLLTWLSFWKGLQGSRTNLWLSAALYLLAVFSKEHAIMVPAVCLAIWILHARSHQHQGLRSSEIASMLALQALIALLVIMIMKGFIGNAYEILAGEHLQDLTHNGSTVQQGLIWPLSIATQAGLYFKYLGLWLLPDVTRMSVDMREPFALTFSPTQMAGLAAFIIYPILSGWLLWKGRTRGLLGLALLAPWLLFATEVSTVRLQEIFVLYRSYLWSPLLFIAFALGFSKMTKHGMMALGILVAISFYALSFDRLTSFSHPYILWDEAAKLAERHADEPGVTGLERIYYNRGNALLRESMLKNAVEDYGRALAIKPDYSAAYVARGGTLLSLKAPQDALADFEKAIRHNPGDAQAHYGRGLALEAIGQQRDSRQSYMTACEMGSQPSCLKLNTAQ